MNVEKMHFSAGFNRVIVQPLEVKPETTANIVMANGVDSKSILSKYSQHPKQAKVIFVGPLDERYEGTVKAGDIVLLRLSTMVEPVIIEGKFFGSVAPSDIIGVSSYHKDKALKPDTDFVNKLA